MKVVFFEKIYYDYEFGVIWPIGIKHHECHNWYPGVYSQSRKKYAVTR